MIKLWQIILLALVLRIVWAAFVEVIPVSDPGAYDTYARNLVEYGVYGLAPGEPGAYWAVGAAAIYAASYSLFGYGDLAVILPNIISSLLITVGIWDLARRWYGGSTADLAALLFAVWPLAIQFTTVLASELHFMAMVLIGLMAWDRAQQITSKEFWIWSAAAGLAFAAATYLRPISLLIPLAMAMSAVFRSPRDYAAPILKSVVATVLILTAVAPWTARNERVFGEPVFMSTNFWANFWMGNHPGTDGGYKEPPKKIHHLGDLERAEWLKEESLGYVKEDPLGFVARTGWKALKLHNRETIGITWNVEGLRAYFGDFGIQLAKAISTGWWYLMVAAAFWGMSILLRVQGFWETLLSPPVWLWGYFTGVHSVVVIGDRYHMPSIPMIAMLAAVGLVALIWKQLPQTHKE